MNGESENKFNRYRLPLGEEVKVLEQEVRMVLPGIQTLFGFQLIAAFNANFKTQLSLSEQHLHLAALILVAVSGVFVTAPAAYHRQARHHISEHFIEVGSRFLTWALAPLAIGTSLDIYLVARYITGSVPVALAIGLVIFSLYAAVWFIYPQIRREKSVASVKRCRLRRR